MNHSSIRQYLQHYGKIRSLRGSVIRSTFRRVTADFDKYDDTVVRTAMEKLNPMNGIKLYCVYCPGEATCWDHLVPAATGGTHQLKNLAPSCTSCNNEKGAKDWKAYLAAKGIPQNDPRWIALSNHTEGYSPRAGFLNPTEQCKFDQLLNDIHRKMEEADDLVLQ